MSEPLLVLLHIPKTAGMTLAAILHRHYGDAFVGGAGESRDTPLDRRSPNVFSRFGQVDSRLRSNASKEGVRAIAGHITFGFHDRLPGDARFLTVLRDPVERTLSHYYFLVRPPERKGGTVGAGFIPPWLPPPPAGLTLEECLTERGYIPDNLQVRMLCGLVSPYDPLPDHALAQAKDNLRDRFAYVGTTERFDEFLAFLNLELGWPTVAYKRSNLNPERPRTEDLPADVLRIVEERNTLDRELHGYAGELLAASLEPAGPELAREIEVLRLADERRSDPPVLDRSWPMEARVALALEEGELAQADLRVKRLRRSLKWRRGAGGPS